MLSCEFFYNRLLHGGVDFFAGVPDSLLKDFCAYLMDHAKQAKHIIAANEGGAVALACGHYLSSSRLGLVYMQNSGQGNAVNPLASLCDPAVYGIPLLLVIGWRGEPKTKDEPQHVKQGEITLKMLDVLGVPHSILPSDEQEAGKCIDEMIGLAQRNSAPSALIIKKGTFSKFNSAAVCENEFEVTRERAIELVVGGLGVSDVVVATTGKISRELYEYRDRCGADHSTDFLSVGSMGHASQIALGIALSRDNQVVCFDGDGSAIMHMGALAIAGSSKASNFKHVIFNNGVHDSVGGQPTVGFNISFTQIALACGYRTALLAVSEDDIKAKMEQLIFTKGPALLEVKVKKGARLNLGRPKICPSENKKTFMEFLSSDQKEYVGSDSLKSLPSILKSLSAKKLFMVTGKGSYSDCSAKDYIESHLSTYEIAAYADFNVNPNISDLESGIEAFNRTGADVVIAIGGGSVIDMAKMINFFAANNVTPMDYISGECKCLNRGKPLVAISTTAGSGSEATCFAVLYIDHVKHSICDSKILPDIAIIDPHLTASMPPRLTAITGMDALSHAIESYWSVNSNDKSRSLAAKAISMIISNLEQAVNSRSSAPKEAMVKAAHLSGKAINITKTTASHAISYPLTSFFGVPHGHAVALTLSSMLLYNYGVTDSDALAHRGTEYVRRSLDDIAKLLGASDMAQAKQIIDKLMREIGLETRLSDLGISAAEDIQCIIDNGFNPSRVKNNPRRLTKLELRQILNSIL